jgi:hypothetical protein
MEVSAIHMSRSHDDRRGAYSKLRRLPADMASKPTVTTMGTKRRRDNVPPSPSPFGVSLVAEAGRRKAIIGLYIPASARAGSCYLRVGRPAGRP